MWRQVAVFTVIQECGGHTAHRGEVHLGSERCSRPGGRLRCGGSWCLLDQAGSQGTQRRSALSHRIQAPQGRWALETCCRRLHPPANVLDDLIQVQVIC